MPAFAGPIAAPQSSTAAALVPSGQWVVAFEQAMCVLSRAYGTGDKEAQLGFRPLPGDERLEIVIRTPWKRVTSYWPGKATVTLEPGKSADGAYSDWKAEADQRRLVRIWVKTAELGDIKAAKTLTVALDKGAQWTFELKGTAKAVQVLDQCQDELGRSWGFDPEVLRKQTLAAPANDPASWITYKDYPQEALRERQAGTVRLKYRVDKDGLPQECAVVQGSGSALLDQASCALIVKRARFRPALGSDGRPQDTLRAETIRWLL